VRPHFRASSGAYEFQVSVVARQIVKRRRAPLSSMSSSGTSDEDSRRPQVGVGGVSSTGADHETRWEHWGFGVDNRIGDRDDSDVRTNPAMVPGVLEAPVTAAVRALTEAVVALQGLAARDGVLPVAGHDVLEVTAALHAAADGVRALAVSATTVVDELDAARSVGCVSTAQWLQREAGMSRGGAGATVGTGRTLVDYPATRAAWLGGEVSEAAVREITTGVGRATRALPPERATVERARCEQVLLHVARSRTPAHVRRAAGKLRVEVDPEGAAQAQEAALDAQFLRFTPVPDGVEVHGFLATEVAAGVLTALDRVIDDYHRTGTLAAEQRAALDSGQPARRRASREQLNARALTDLVATALGEGRLGVGRGQRPHVTYTMHHDELGAGLGGEVLLPGFGRVAVPTATLERVLCDAEVHPVLTRRDTRPSGVPPRPVLGIVPENGAPPPGQLLDAFAGAVDPHPDDVDTLLDDDTLESWGRRLAGERGRHVLDLGRTFRTAPPDLRRALEIRDGGCVAPGCHVDPSRCEAHHVVYWRHGGTTSLRGMALVCLSHHHDIHEGGWTLAPRPGSEPGDPGRWIRTPPPPRSHPDD